MDTPVATEPESIITIERATAGVTRATARRLDLRNSANSFHRTLIINNHLHATTSVGMGTQVDLEAAFTTDSDTTDKNKINRIKLCQFLIECFKEVYLQRTAKTAAFKTRVTQVATATQKFYHTVVGAMEYAADIDRDGSAAAELSPFLPLLDGMVPSIITWFTCSTFLNAQENPLDRELAGLAPLVTDILAAICFTVTYKARLINTNSIRGKRFERIGKRLKKVSTSVLRSAASAA